MTNRYLQILMSLMGTMGSELGITQQQRQAMPPRDALVALPPHHKLVFACSNSAGDLPEGEELPTPEKLLALFVEDYAQKAGFTEAGLAVFTKGKSHYVYEKDGHKYTFYIKEGYLCKRYLDVRKCRYADAETVKAWKEQLEKDRQRQVQEGGTNGQTKRTTDTEEKNGNPDSDGSAAQDEHGGTNRERTDQIPETAPARSEDHDG